MKAIQTIGFVTGVTVLFLVFQADASIGRGEEPPGALSNSIGMRLVPIRAGTFQMGSPPGEPGRGRDERQHEVMISGNYHMGAHEVTQSQFAKIMEGDNPSFFQGMAMKKWFEKDTPTLDYPVESVTWFDAVKFCQRLSDIPAEKMAGRVYRLPTEAEWEYACRAGTTSRFFFGEDEGDLRFYAWFRPNAGQRTHPVGQKRPNSWGLHDMYGNVWEWCSDWYEPEYPSGAVKDPKGPDRGSLKVIRGGDWGDEPPYCRSAERDSIQPGHTGNDRGFRVVMIQGQRSR